MTTAPADPGRIITFYSYKGGTGRSMALANVAWILASNGYRVLVVDWDLEAPGLHRYFAPFMLDPELLESDGVIDIVHNYVTALMTPPQSEPPPSATTPLPDTTPSPSMESAQPREDSPSSPPRDPNDPATWHEPYADVLRYATSLTWRFPPCEERQGWIDFIPAGRQGATYGARMNAFSWQNFYDRLGGGGFIEALKVRMKEEYDYVLIDSRTGVSDTSGVCTVQLPDVLAVCFTLNRQSIEGAGAVCASVLAARQSLANAAPLRIFPIPTRVEKAEKEKLDLAHDAAADQFAPVLSHVDESNWKQYWGDVEVMYEPFYAYEEVLATFRDTLDHPASMLSSMQRITAWLTDTKVTKLVPADEAERQRVLTKYARESRKARGGKGVSVDSDLQFYISYARSDLDESLERFFTDLAREVRALTGAAMGASGFVDLDIAAGADWQQQLEHAIRRSRVLVPIYSPAYFTSENTGREFQHFLARSGGVTSRPGILPVIWMQPTQPLPPAVARLAYTAATFPEEYKNLGLRSLMRLRRYDDVYTAFLKEYAARLVENARGIRLPEGPVTPLVDLPSAFGGTSSASTIDSQELEPQAASASTEEVLRTFVRAIPTLEREVIEDVCERDLAPRLRARAAPSLEVPAILSLLDSLRRRRLYRAVQTIGEAAIAGRERSPAMLRFAAEALLRQNKPALALPILKGLQQDAPADSNVRAEISELAGEAAKRLYVSSDAPLLPANRQHMVRAVRAYMDAYRLEPGTLWNGINVAALALRASRDGVILPLDIFDDQPPLEPPSVRARDLANTLMQGVQARVSNGDAGFWDFAVAAQAALALEQPMEVLDWVASCVHESVDAFDLSSLLQELTDTWQVESESDAGRLALPLLRASLLRQEGSEMSLSWRDAGRDTHALLPADQSFQRLVGAESVEMLRWYGLGLDRAVGIGLIEMLDGRPPGAGIVIPGSDLHPEWAGTPHLVTTASALRLSMDGHGPIQPPEAIVRLEAMHTSHRLGGIVFASGELDVAVAMLESMAFYVPPQSWARRPPVVDGQNCTYTLSCSPRQRSALTMNACLVLDHDASRIHVRSSVNAIPPGSPMFNQQWELTGLHRGQDNQLPKLNGKLGTYRASEAVWLGVVRDAITAQSGS